MAKMERTPSDYADIEAAVEAGDLDQAEQLLASKQLSGEDQQICQNLINEARSAQPRRKTAKEGEETSDSQPSGSTGASSSKRSSG